jgi:hypothetical protein
VAGACVHDPLKQIEAMEHIDHDPLDLSTPAHVINISTEQRRWHLFRPQAAHIRALPVGLAAVFLEAMLGGRESLLSIHAARELGQWHATSWCWACRHDKIADNITSERTAGNGNGDDGR